MGNDFLIVVALGDSLTSGYRASDPYSLDRRVPYPSQLEVLIRQRVTLKGSGIQTFVVNAGINGDSTDGMVARFDRSVAAEKPDAVIVWGGINDLFSGRRPEHVAANLAKLYARCREIRAAPVACTVSPTAIPSPDIPRLTALIKEICENDRIPLADVYTALVDAEGALRSEYSDDGAHLNPPGYGVVARTVFATIEPILTDHGL